MIQFWGNSEYYITRLGRVRKNSGGKRQAYYQSQVTTGKRRTYRLLIAGYFCLRPLPSGFFTGQWPETEIASNQKPVCPVVPALTCAGDRPALFPPLFFALSLLNFLNASEFPRLIFIQCRFKITQRILLINLQCITDAKRHVDSQWMKGGKIVF